MLPFSSAKPTSPIARFAALRRKPAVHSITAARRANPYPTRIYLISSSSPVHLNPSLRASSPSLRPFLSPCISVGAPAFMRETSASALRKVPAPHFSGLQPRPIGVNALRRSNFKSFTVSHPRYPQTRPHMPRHPASRACNSPSPSPAPHPPFCAQSKIQTHAATSQTLCAAQAANSP